MVVGERRFVVEGRTVEEDGRWTEELGLLDTEPLDPELGRETDGAVRGTITGADVEPLFGTIRLLGARLVAPGVSGPVREPMASPPRLRPPPGMTAELGRDRGTKGFTCAGTSAFEPRGSPPASDRVVDELGRFRSYSGELGLVVRIGRSAACRTGAFGALTAAAAERRLIAAAVVGSTRRSASSPRRPGSRARIGVMSRSTVRSTPRNTRSSSPAGRACDGGAVVRGSDVTIPTSSRPRSAVSPGSTRRDRCGLAKSLVETTFQAVRSTSAKIGRAHV